MLKLEPHQLQQLASAMVGDGDAPNVYFVTDRGNVTMVTTDKNAARNAFNRLSLREPLLECALEDRQTGVLASVEPESDEQGARLVKFA